MVTARGIATESRKYSLPHADPLSTACCRLLHALLRIHSPPQLSPVHGGADRRACRVAGKIPRRRPSRCMQPPLTPTRIPARSPRAGPGSESCSMPNIAYSRGSERYSMPRAVFSHHRNSSAERATQLASATSSAKQQGGKKPAGSAAQAKTPVKPSARAQCSARGTYRALAGPPQALLGPSRTAQGPTGP